MKIKINKKFFNTLISLFFIGMLARDYQVPLLSWFLNKEYDITAARHLNKTKAIIQDFSDFLHGNSWRLGNIKYSRMTSWRYVNNVIHIDGCVKYSDIDSFFIKNDFYHKSEENGYCKDNIIFYNFFSHENFNGLCNEIYFYIQWDKNKDCL